MAVGKDKQLIYQGLNRYLSLGGLKNQYGVPIFESPKLRTRP